MAGHSYSSMELSQEQTATSVPALPRCRETPKVLHKSSPRRHSIARFASQISRSGEEKSSGEHCCHRDRAVLSSNDDDPGVGHMPSARLVRLKIVTNFGVRGNSNVLVEDGPPHLGVASDVAVIHNDAAFDRCAGVHTHGAAQNGLPRQAPGENASSRYDAVERFASPPVLVEDELCGGIGIAGAPHRPFAVVKV